MTESRGRGRPPTTDPAVRAELATKAIAAYVEGRPIRAIVREVGGTYSLVRQLLIDGGVEFRTKGGNDRRGPQT